MKTVLHILNTGEYSGAENVVITIINNYSEDFRGIYMSRKGSIGNIVEQYNIEYYGVDKLSLAEIKHVINRYHPDLIHAHDFTASILASVVAKEIPVISHLHNNVPWMKKISVRSILYRLVLNKFSKILTVSDSVLEECWYCEIMKKKGICVGNPIDLERIRGEKTQIIFSKLLFVGRLTEQKNPIEFLKIVNELHGLGYAITATMLGRGELEKECQTYIRENNLQQVVFMKGFVENPYNYMNEGTILILPSLWEGFGLVAVEALSFGVPVVANPVGGLNKIVDNSCGCLAMSHEKKIQELKKLLENVNYYKMKSQKAKKKANQIANIEEYMNILTNIYMETIGGDKI